MGEKVGGADMPTVATYVGRGNDVFVEDRIFVNVQATQSGRIAPS